MHSHTLHSEETLNFIYRLASHYLPIRVALRRAEARYLAAHGHALNLRRAWWTPPAAPEEAWLLERSQIEDRLGLQALVSLTDHDSIEAPLQLRALESCRTTPISTEWTVPYGPTFFHLGIHNMSPASALRTIKGMLALTRAQRTIDLAELLEGLAANPQTLIVFNHPCWDEKAIGKEQHMEYAIRFAGAYGKFLHALELNGLRPWTENRRVLDMARALGKPVISGGDRHGLEPNVILDLTDAATFGEYVEQVRSGWTDVLIANGYREPFGLRILRSLEEILGDHESHRRGWRKWNDRVFFRCDDGAVRSLTELIPDTLPGGVKLFVKSVEAFRRHSVRRTLNQVLRGEGEFAL